MFIIVMSLNTVCNKYFALEKALFVFINNKEIKFLKIFNLTFFLEGHNLFNL